MRAFVATEHGVAEVDVDDEVVLRLDPSASRPPRRRVDLSLPRVVDADAVGSRVVAVVGRRPPLVLSDDAGMTWREAGGGLPPGQAVAIHPDDPDLVLYAARNRLYVSRDGGRFWQVLAPELPAIGGVAWQ